MSEGFQIKGLKDLKSVKDISLQDILITMMDGDSDLELKTQIFNPKDLAGLSILATALKLDKLPKSSQLISEFIKTYLRYMVSYKRQSRTELINAVSGMLDRESKKDAIKDKLTKNQL